MTSFITTIIAILLLVSIQRSTAIIKCNSTSTCENFLRHGSQCVDGICTNPFAQGCLRRIYGETSYRRRTCNSDDGTLTENPELCSPSPLSYTEIRIISANWESAIFYAWVIQIILSELLDVPTSIEISGEGALNFYDIKNSFSYPSKIYDFEALLEGNRVLDCSTSSKPCGNFMPEVWESRRPLWEKYFKEGYIKHPSYNGLQSRIGIYTQKHVVDKYPSLISYLGFAGETNREKLAQIFKRPTTWGDYCQKVSESNCENDDGIAARQPKGKEEEESYFVENLYKGHFRATEKNNCAQNPQTCTGHIVDYPCDWIGYNPTQFYWNNIALESNGPMSGGTYSYNHVIQIFHAANHTNAPLMVVWWEPEPRIGAFGYIRVDLPKPTLECIENRPYHGRCTGSKERLIGDMRGSCDYENILTQKIMASSLRTSTFGIPKARQSPAYFVLDNIYLTNEDFTVMLDDWWARGIDTYGYDPRDAVCSWVSKNLDDLRKTIPIGYPRLIREGSKFNTPFLYTAMGFGLVVIVVVIITTIATYHNRRKRPIKYASLNFLYIILLGFLLVSIGAILHAMVPTNASCIARQWLETIGYTTGIVPLLIKVTTINKMVLAAERFRRKKISQRRLFGWVALAIVLISIFLSIWTVFDPPNRVEVVYLSEESESIVQTRIYCESKSNIWIIIVLSWEFLQVLCTLVLAFWSRNVREEYNESKALARLSYSHFFFLLIRMIIYMTPPEVIEPSVREGISSYVMSLDSLTALCIYFGPKFNTIRKHKNRPRGSMNTYTDRSSHSSRPMQRVSFVGFGVRLSQSCVAFDLNDIENVIDQN